VVDGVGSSTGRIGRELANCASGGIVRTARALVTGSNRGIGLEFVRQYLAAGYEVIATCRDPSSAHELTAFHGALRIAKLDISSEEDLDALMMDLGDLPVDVLICNAAVFGGARSRFENIDWAAWRSALEVNLLGSIRVAMRLSKNVEESTERKVIFVSSRAGLAREARPHMSYIYASSKAALNAAVRCLALDLQPRGVTVVLVNPGHVKTRIGGAAAPMRVDESVSKMREIIANLGPGQAGRFWHVDGSELPL
jgi:NAD(P)-dependent dehydrogenase (short-subunit alcohol dehydrogenase family)